ncbi:hypothetical protein CPY51_27375 [Rhizobium tubonense]|uniref:Uncharacterized protein n=1 Tax=Rhizobium tubonense TaxID=484088 RepID=A0A2W4C7J9_9HYPH|nr:hypothetical protein CPY51_27375 [Rhizobium tubonense]
MPLLLHSYPSLERRGRSPRQLCTFDRNITAVTEIRGPSCAIYGMLLAGAVGFLSQDRLRLGVEDVTRPAGKDYWPSQSKGPDRVALVIKSTSAKLDGNKLVLTAVGKSDCVHRPLRGGTMQAGTGLILRPEQRWVRAAFRPEH